MCRKNISSCMRILWLGVGDLWRKAQFALQQFLRAGVEIHGVDIQSSPTGLDALEPTEFYNATNSADMQRLVELAKQEPFEMVYVATYPELHLFEAIKFQNLSQAIVIAKPLDAVEHLSMVETMMEPTRRLLFKNFIDKTRIHDHYRNKPSLSVLHLILPELHAMHGFIRQMRLFLVENKSVNEEWHRRAALECGMIS